MVSKLRKTRILPPAPRPPLFINIHTELCSLVTMGMWHLMSQATPYKILEAKTGRKRGRALLESYKQPSVLAAGLGVLGLVSPARGPLAAASPLLRPPPAP